MVDINQFESRDYQMRNWYQGCGGLWEEDAKSLGKAERKGLVAEPKRDGHFGAFFFCRDGVRVWSRNRKPKTYALPAHAPSAGTLVVGEIGQGRQEAVRRREEIGHNFADLWAVLVLRGEDVTDLPDAEQREMLLSWHAELPRRLQEYYLPVPRWDCGFHAQYEREHEGIVLKDAARSYVPGVRSPWWYKVKHCHEADVATMEREWSSAASRQGLPKSIVCGQWIDGELRPVVRVNCNGGYLQHEMTVNWRPGRVMTIRHFGMTEPGPDGLRRFNHPSFGGFREDKEPQECVPGR